MILLYTLQRIHNVETQIHLQREIYEENSIYLKQSRPYLEGIRLINGADVVIANPSCFENLHLNQSTYTGQQLQNQISEECQTKTFYETYMSPRQFSNFLNHQLARSICSANDHINTLIYGAYIEYDPADCIAQNTYVCTWYESTSMYCRRWTELQTFNIKVAFEASYLDVITKLYPDLLVWNSECNIIQASQRFVTHYDSQYFVEFGEASRGKTILGSKMSIVVIIFLLVSAYQTIKSFYSEAEEDEQVIELIEEDDAEERRFARMTRRKIIEVLAGVQG
ncbi:Conserved_hypothetical protein [Hexamita inflata]|uniref:Uncharacterized protein n=1 Tax=Hexamita inflata TaxID=28002 RepID=A0AA86RDY1_9EUKA|nr:Conserved hypothetical protein [Hexamita inflata]CAI9971282.1 Conserved hypothetical protein [Hexamita inflata]CAI9976035.1 Conserved hypothetical protein [Hexamita inflata]